MFDSSYCNKRSSYSDSTAGFQPASMGLIPIVRIEAYSLVVWMLRLHRRGEGSIPSTPIAYLVQGNGCLAVYRATWVRIPQWALPSVNGGRSSGLNPESSRHAGSNPAEGVASMAE